MIDEKKLIEAILSSKKAKCCYCIECKYGKLSDECTMREISIDDLISVIDKMPKENDWTACKDELPKEKDYYMVTVEGEQGRCVEYVKFMKSSEGGYWFTPSKVIAWKPFQEPYKGE